MWEALLAQGMPQTALMRQLPRLTNVFGKDGSWAQTVAAQLQDAEALKRGRVHPINVLMAQRTYASGHGVRGKSTWTPVRRITNALDAAFYNAYGAVEPSGKRTLVALDVSASMSWVTIGDTGLQPREAAAALALVTLATEPNSEVVAFTSSRSFSHASNFGITPVDITPRRRLDDVMALTSRLPAGGTDCALPFVWAAKQGLDFETATGKTLQTLPTAKLSRPDRVRFVGENRVVTASEDALLKLWDWAPGLLPVATQRTVWRPACVVR